MTNPTVTPGEGSVNALADQLRHVAVAREAYAIAKSYMDGRRRLFEEANADAISAVEDIRAEMAAAEMEARGLALMAYAATGSKQPHAGVGIRVTTRMVYDHHLALDWAIDHHMALGLDVKAFEGIAKTGVAGSFVTFTQEPTATIAADLSKALGLEPVAGGGSE